MVMHRSSRSSGGSSMENLHDNGISSDGLYYCFFMVDLGEVAPVHLEEEDVRLTLLRGMGLEP